MTRSLSIAGLIVAVTACAHKLPIENQPCPCAANWYCDKSGGEPGVCKEGRAPDAGAKDSAPDTKPPQDATPPDAGPKPFCTTPVASFRDRFEDGHIDDWKVYEGNVTLAGGRLLAVRTQSAGQGLAGHRFTPGPDGFSIEALVELNSDSSVAGLSLGKVTSPKGYSVVLSNSTTGSLLTGLFLRADPTAFFIDKTIPLLISHNIMPVKDKRYLVKLEVRSGGRFTLSLDGKVVGQATDTTLTDFNELYVGGGQSSKENRGAYFDDVVVRSCGIKLPTFTPDSAANPIWQGAAPYSIFKEGANGFRLYHGGSGNLHVSTSSDGKTWTEKKNVINKGHTTHEFNRQASVIKTKTGFLALISSTSKACIAFTDVYGATSADGETWTSTGKVLAHGKLGEYDSRNVSVGSVVFDGATYHMYYDTDATSSATCDPPIKRWKLGVGYATSTDGKTWKKHGIVLALGASGEPDSAGYGHTTVLRNQGAFEMYTSGGDGKSQVMIYATSKDGRNWTKHGITTLPAGGVVGEIDGKIYYICGSAICRATIKR